MPPPDDEEDGALSLSLPFYLLTTHGCGQTVTVMPPPDDDASARQVSRGQQWQGECGGMAMMRMRQRGQCPQALPLSPPICLQHADVDRR